MYSEANIRKVQFVAEQKGIRLSDEQTMQIAASSASGRDIYRAVEELAGKDDGYSIPDEEYDEEKG